MFNFSFFSVTGWSIDLDYYDDEWCALERNPDHSVVFEIVPKHCISDSLVDYDCSIYIYMCVYIHFIHIYYIHSIKLNHFSVQRNQYNIVNQLFVVVQLFSRVRLFAIPWTAACQAPLSFVISALSPFLKVLLFKILKKDV